ncbi:MAG TPA: rhodoquinone biosynthesis methyltransferase RquA [Woeseiaceae bacterium]
MQNSTAESAKKVPEYLDSIYNWAYLNPKHMQFLDKEIVVRTILWQQHNKLERAAFTEIEPGQRVLQPACVYGKFSPALAAHIGAEGSLEVVDVAEVQVNNVRRKLKDFPQAKVRQSDVLHLEGENYDTVCCYFLMHELPDDYKQGAADVLLSSVPVGGKVVFVDYHKPHWAHPLRPIMSLVFKKLEPFAKSLWRNEISSFTQHADRFSWRKETYFGGLYQKVVATRTC